MYLVTSTYAKSDLIVLWIIKVHSVINSIPRVNSLETIDIVQIRFPKRKSF